MRRLGCQTISIKISLNKSISDLWASLKALVFELRSKPWTFCLRKSLPVSISNPCSNLTLVNKSIMIDRLCCANNGGAGN